MKDCGDLIRPKSIELLSAALHDLSGTLDPDRLLEDLADFFVRNLDTAACCVKIFHPDWRDTGLDPVHTFPADAGEEILALCRQLNGEGEPRTGPALIERVSGGASRPPGTEGPLLHIEIPFVFKGTTIGMGTLWVPDGSVRSDSSSLRDCEEDRKALSALGEEIALRIVNVMLHCRAENLLLERRERLRELWVLQETNNALRGTVKLNTILKMILAGATTELGLGFNRAALFLLNERTNLLQGMLGVGPDSEEEAARIWNSLSDQGDPGLARQIKLHAENQPRTSRFDSLVKSIRIPLDTSVGTLGLCISGRRAVLAGTAAGSPEPERELSERLSMTEFAATPISAMDRTFGVMVVDNIFDKKAITGKDLRLLTMFAGQAGLAIASAKAHLSHQQAVEELRTARIQLVQTERLAALGEIAANLAHEIRNPLVTIGGFARRLERKFDEGDSNRRYAGIIAKEVQRLEHFLEQVLLFGQDRKPLLTSTPIEDVIEDTVPLFSSQFDEAGIAVSLDLPPGLPSLEADPNQLRQVFINLFTNAADVMPGGGELTIAASAQEGPPASVVVTVSDTGGGGRPRDIG
ncbi:histidine kinase dimerization/phospho-acceptor domain-containing protein [Candidatus Moduliflexota bacterium]